jgi:hypothetical protein
MTQGHEFMMTHFVEALVRLAHCQHSDKRLSQAVTRLCGYPVTFTRDELAAFDACRTDAMKAAAPQIDAARARLAVAVASNR